MEFRLNSWCESLSTYHAAAFSRSGWLAKKLTLSHFVIITSATSGGRHRSSKIPGYIAFSRLAKQIVDTESSHGFKPALIEMEDGLVPGFIVEQHPGERFTVFIPSAPAPAAGQIYIFAAARVHPIDIPVATMFQCVAKWGTNSAELLRAMEDKKSRSQDPGSACRPAWPEAN